MLVDGPINGGCQDKRPDEEEKKGKASSPFPLIFSKKDQQP